MVGVNIAYVTDIGKLVGVVGLKEVKFFFLYLILYFIQIQIVIYQLFFIASASY